MIGFLLPTPVSAQEKSDIPADPEEGWAELSKLAASKRAAAIGLYVKRQNNRVAPHVGVFIAADGLALVSLESLARGVTPEVRTADGTELGFGTILSLLPEAELALMKFEHRPKTWLRLAPQEPEVGDAVALIPINSEKMLDGRITPVIGQIMAKRSGTTANLRLTRFRRVMSFGAGFTADQRARSGLGCIAIDRAGDLIGFSGVTQVNRRQTLHHLNSVDKLAARIPGLLAAGKTIPFPLPAANNFSDLALLDSEFYQLGMAVRQRDLEATRLKLEELLKRFPDSLNLKILATNPTALGAGKPLVQAADLTPDPGDPKGHQCACLMARGRLHLAAGDGEDAIRDLEAAVALSPDDFLDSTWSLGEVYLRKKRPEDAEHLLREAYAIAPESIDVIELLKDALFANKKYDEFGELTKRVGELSEIYQRKWGVEP